jgi:integrase
VAITQSIKVRYRAQMGSLRERSPGVWQARVYNGLDPVSGARRYVARTIHAKTETAAQREMRKLARQVAAGRAPRGTTAVTLGEQLDDWYANKKARLAPGTRLGYESAMKLCEPLRAIPLGKVSARDLDALYAALGRQGKATSTIRKAHLVISAALAQAVRHDLLDRNVALNADPPAVRSKQTRPPTIEELAQLLDAADDDFRVFLFVAMTTGARRGELAALRWRDVDLDARTITIRQSVAEDRDSILIKDTKSHQVRAVALDDETVAMLAGHQERVEKLAAGCGSDLTPDRFVFSPRPGNDTCYVPKVISRRFTRLCERTKIKGLRLHDLRHFAGSQLVAAGVDIRTVSARLGHSRPSITLDIYSHRVQDNDRAAAEILGQLIKPRAKGES